MSGGVQLDSNGEPVGVRTAAPGAPAPKATDRSSKGAGLQGLVAAEPSANKAAPAHVKPHVDDGGATAHGDDAKAGGATTAQEKAAAAAHDAKAHVDAKAHDAASHGSKGDAAAGHGEPAEDKAAAGDAGTTTKSHQAGQHAASNHGSSPDGAAASGGQGHGAMDHGASAKDETVANPAPHDARARDMAANDGGRDMADHGGDHAAADHGVGGHDMPHGMGNHDHMQALALVDPADATHVAVQSGDWFNPETWADGRVPGEDARVTIPEGVSVTYDEVSEARIMTIGVEGELRFDQARDSKLVVDTLVVAPGGRLEAGTVERPVADGVSIDIVIANNGDIDTAWDPTLISRGVVALGEVEMRGAEKTSHFKAAEDPMTGDQTLTLAEPADGWRVGDTIVVAGTDFDGWGYAQGGRQYRGDTHEVRTITSVDGAVVTIDQPLEFDHASPRGDLKTSIANYSRSVTISSEDGAASETHHRGHVAVMGDGDVDIRYVAFDELGRTDKSERARPVSEVETVAADSNVQGRYAVHLHERGVGDGEDPVVLAGNAVFGSPGWGFVNHSSNADFFDNAAYDVFGAGFVAEKGDETGTWTRNISIDNEGLLRFEKDFSDVAAFDLGRAGAGFWFSGRLIEAQDNVAAGARTGFVWMSRGDTADVDPLTYDQPEALGLGAPAKASHPVIRNFNGNEVFGSEQGLTVIKGDPSQGHDLRTVMTDFTAWEVRGGAHIEYSSHYTLVDFDLVALKDPPQFTEPGAAISAGNNTSDFVIVDAEIDGFRFAYSLSGAFTGARSGARDEDNQFFVVGGETSNLIAREFQNRDFERRVTVLDDARPGDLSVDVEVNDIAGRNRAVVFRGEKTDSIGEAPVPSGLDRYALSYADVRTILATDGFFTLDGQQVFVAEAYYEDRLTGEILKVGHLVEAAGEIFGVPRGIFPDAVFNGEFNADNRAPVAIGEAAVTFEERPVVIDLLANDRDPDGDAIRVDGILQPARGRVVDNGDGTVTYTPDVGHAGPDTFFYWVTDGFGAFTKAQVAVSVRENGPNAATESSFAGTRGADALFGTANEDRILGGRGDDRLAGRAGDDTLGGGAGDDTLNGGRDADLLQGAGGADLLSGQGGADLLRAGAGDDVARGGGGADLLNGKGGRDKLLGGASGDVAKGGAGADLVKGGGGDDALFGGAGRDTIEGGFGDDTLSGGDKADLFVFNRGDDVILDFEDGVDMIEVEGRDFAALLVTADEAGAQVAYEGGSILLKGVAADDLEASDFIF